MLLVVFIVACSSENVEETGDKFQSIVAELRAPWDIEHSESTFYISERAGSIVSWQEGEGKERLPVQTDRDILQRGEGGLLGLRLHPDFATNARAFAYHTYEENGAIQNRVIVLEKQSDTWKEVDVILEGIPGARFHNGGRLEVGPDEKLYVTTGDALQESIAQDRGQLAGKILRMNLDGSVPADNPSEGSHVYSYGHRNPQGIAWSDSGEMFASEHGPDAHDEINQIKAGENYGWPDAVGENHGDSVMAPIFQTGDNTWAPSGIVVHDDRLFIATLRGTALRTLLFSGEDPQVVTNSYGRIRDVEKIDDEVYFITNNTDGRGNPADGDDKLVRFSP
nr:PQQ-dependent sugar dehydrogenase [Halobacillus locisalis]